MRTEELKELLKNEGIIYLTEEEFNEMYPNAFESTNNKYTNIPREYIIVENERNYTAIDNTTGDAWCEDFFNLGQACSWIKGFEGTPKYKLEILQSPQRIGNRWKNGKTKRKKELRCSS